MTTALHLDARAGLWRAANRARWAPSIHNTQPWRLHLHRDTLELRLDPARILPTTDPDGRQAFISCGCALFNARVSLAGEEAAETTVARFPEGTDSTLLARLHVARGRARTRSPGPRVWPWPTWTSPSRCGGRIAVRSSAHSCRHASSTA